MNLSVLEIEISIDWISIFFQNLKIVISEFSKGDILSIFYII